MKNSVRISALLAFHILCYSMIELKDTGLFGSMSYVILYCLFNLLFAAGIVLYGFLRESFTKLFAKKAVLLMFCLVYWLLGILTIFSGNLAVYMLSVCVSALFSGIIGGASYYSIYAGVSKWQRGRSIGAGLLFGTLAQYFIELSRLIPNKIYFVFLSAGVFFIASAGIFMLLPVSRQNKKNAGDEKERTGIRQNSFRTFCLILIAATAIICYLSSLYEGIMAVVSTGELSAYEMILLRNTKLLYCASVAAAGFIADLKGRQYISVIAIAVMTLLIFDVFLLNYTVFKFLNWIILFAGSGFLAMFVTLNFIDIADQTKIPALWAGGGRIVKHLVTAFGSVAGALLWNTPESGFLIVGLQYLVLLTALIFLLFWHYLITENASGAVHSPQESLGNSLAPEIAGYGFTDKEKQVLQFILTGVQIKDIAEKLFVTERTVKFHITNILKKTGCKNQRELISSFANSYFFRR